MAEFLTANGISFYIEKIIKEAEKELYILFPHLQLSREFYEVLEELSLKGTPVIIVYTTEDLQTEQKLMLAEFPNLEIYHSENLNAKCCCSENDVLITSMDIHQLNLGDNIEMGILFNKIKDNEQYKKASGEIKSITGSSKNMNLHKRPVQELHQPDLKVKKIYHGFCIKCAMPISYNIGNPYCRRCMPKSNSSAEIDESGEYCHLCGMQSSTNANSPLCDACKAENL